jgi:hypothetical protein
MDFFKSVQLVTFQWSFQVFLLVFLFYKRWLPKRCDVVRGRTNVEESQNTRVRVIHSLLLTDGLGDLDVTKGFYFSCNRKPASHRCHYENDLASIHNYLVHLAHFGCRIEFGISTAVTNLPHCVSTQIMSFQQQQKPSMFTGAMA